MCAHTLTVHVSGDPVVVAQALESLAGAIRRGTFRTGSTPMMCACDPTASGDTKTVGHATWHEDCTFEDIIAKESAR